MAWQFLLNAFSIVLIDLILAGDNAVVIALAARGMPSHRRFLGIAIGAGFAVVFRVAATAFAARLLEIHFVQLLGGFLILWIAVKVFRDAKPLEPGEVKYQSFWKGIGLIVIADITMSLDNILAIAAASHGNLGLLLLGLGLSIPFVIFSSGLLSLVMDKYPFLVYLAAAILGRVGAQMIMTDRFTVRVFGPSDFLRYSVEAIAAVGVIVAGRLLRRR